MTNPSYVPHLSTKVCLAVLLPVLLGLGCGKSAEVAGPGHGPKPVSLASNGSETIIAGDLASAGSYVILAKTGISKTAGASTITGNIGVSPVAYGAITGFSLTPNDDSAVFSTSTSVVDGKVYAANYIPPTPVNMSKAISNVEAAYTDAAGRTPPDFTELASGNIGGLILTTGLYKWSSTVTIPADVTLSGGANDVWIFQIAGDLTMSASKNVVLSGGAQAKNIFWQVAGQVNIGTNAHFEGTILCQTAITLQTGASMNGRAYSQSQVSLDNNIVIQK